MTFEVDTKMNPRDWLMSEIIIAVLGDKVVDCNKIIYGQNYVFF